MTAYTHSSGLKKFKNAQKNGHPLRLALLDIDGTWAGTSEEQTVVRQLLEENGHVTGVVTSRLANMCVSASDHPPNELALLQGLLDTDIIIATTGTEVLIKQADGTYQPDSAYYQRLPNSSRHWHQQVQQFLAEIQVSGIVFKKAEIPFPNFRVELQCGSQQHAVNLLSAITVHSNSSAFHIAREDYKIFITPVQASKEDAANHVIHEFRKHIDAPLSSISLLLAGDSAVEAKMGLAAGLGTQAVFLVPGGASLYKERHQPTLQFFIQELTKSENSARLPAGVYQVKDQSRHVIFGDEAFPDTAGPQTLIAWLRQVYS